MAKKKKEPEYVLRMYHHLDERTNKKGVVFAVETAEIFTNFKYEILLEDKFAGNELELKIIGLHAPAMLMPSRGPARGTREYFDLKGIYTVRINRMDKETNDIRVEISDSRIIIKEIPPNSFITALVDSMKITKV